MSFVYYLYRHPRGQHCVQRLSVKLAAKSLIHGGKSAGAGPKSQAGRKLRGELGEPINPVGLRSVIPRIRFPDLIKKEIFLASGLF